MLNLHKVSKSYGAETILNGVSFVVNPGDRAALIGPNGSGKSTLLKIAAGVLQHDSGAVSAPSDLRIGYLPQGLPLDETRTARETILAGMPDWLSAKRSMQELAEKAAAAGRESPAPSARTPERESERYESILSAYGEAQTRFESLGGFGREHEVEKTAAGLGLPSDLLDRSLADLSGGQRTRVGLARLLLSAPELLLLDEPTNHLDIRALEWLEETLGSFPGGMLVVSHDRVFLDRIATRVLALDQDSHTLREYPGNYSDYAAAHAAELDKTRQAYREQQAEIRRQEADIHRTKMQAKSVELTTTSRQPNVRRYAKKVAKKAKSREKKLARYKDSDEMVEKPTANWQMKLDFDDSMRSGQRVLDIRGLSFSYGIDSDRILDGIDLALTYGDRVVLVGDNGSGKSTLLKIIAGELNPKKGRLEIGASVRIGYMPQEQGNLPHDLTPLDVIQGANPMSETDARSFLHYFLFEGDSAVRPIGSLSYGERARLILAGLVVRGSNFLVLDEPVNHLDIPSRERFESALDAFPGTVLAALHDRALIRSYARRIVWMENGRLIEDERPLT